MEHKEPQRDDAIYVVIGKPPHLRVAVGSFVEGCPNKAFCYARYVTPAADYQYGHALWAWTWEEAQKIAVREIEDWRSKECAEGANQKAIVRSTREESWMRKRLDACIEASKNT